MKRSRVLIRRMERREEQPDEGNIARLSRSP